MTGVVGDRTLIAIQAVNISRLSTHPVPIVPGTLIVVAGQGPKDSNGAGKSSFIAAITALLGDEQWRFASGARAVSELLFNAELAAQGDNKWSSADHGFIVGVFAPAGDSADAVTVWLRVNTAAPHLEIRWADGIHLASAPSEAERVALADELWTGLPRSAGRRDLVAKDLNRVLYGDQARCVSFLSTSVRSKVATNLLSQPLNEISPERIFSAIAALTGLDRELDAERKARAEEHRERTKAAEAAARLAEWEAESASLIETFDRRDRARRELEAAQRCWRACQARQLADAAEHDTSCGAEQDRLRAEIKETTSAIKAVDDEISQLTGGELDNRLAGASGEHAEFKGQIERLLEEKAVAKNRIEELRRQAAVLEERHRGADGRDLETAQEELTAAERQRDEAQQYLGMAKGVVETAERDLADTEAGEGAAREQIKALAAAGIPAVGLVDAVDVDEEVRARWEAALWPYREAAVVGADDLDQAAEVLRKLPGSMIIAADGPVGGGQGDGIEVLAGVRAQVSLNRFCAALDDRYGDERIDGVAGVIVVGGFADAVTGRVARVQAARARLTAARESFDRGADRAGEADAALSIARRRLDGARAGLDLQGTHDKVNSLRERLETLNTSTDELTPQLRAAELSIRRLQAKADNRAQEADRLRDRKARREETRARAQDRVAALQDQRAKLGITTLSEDWGGTPEAAREWLLALGEDERSWSPDNWWHSAERHLGEALRQVFPEGREESDTPEEIRFLLTERAEGAGRRTEREQATFPRLAQALGSYLRSQEDYEQHQRRQIEIQSNARRSDLEKARTGATESAGAAAAHRSALTAAIRARLQAVAEQFSNLDLAYGGYGATLEFPTPEPPPDPEHEWRWRVIPKWRRADGQRYVPYNRRANTALMDEKAVKLVCAAALASTGGGGKLCLVLDELGRNLGKEHRKEAVALFRQIGETHGITVIGALQDDMEPYAIDACGQYVKLRRSSDTMAYNEPPVVVGYDVHAERVNALADAVGGARP